MGKTVNSPFSLAALRDGRPPSCGPEKFSSRSEKLLIAIQNDPERHREILLASSLYQALPKWI